MTLLRWHESNRVELSRTLPEALVVVPVGATEQHGPHLATGTDWILARTVSERAAEEVHKRAGRPLILAPPVPFGSSDHHLPFGGTLSLSAETLQAVLLDLARSIADSGGRRVVFVNGHGGNTGICRTVASVASTRYELAAATVDYWRLAPRVQTASVPGHAGLFETSMVLAVDPSLVGDAEPRDEVPDVPVVSDVDVHTAGLWQRIDGYTDRPEHAAADLGERWLKLTVAALGRRLVELAEVL
ncbi:creatininase family protein [Kribbella swartbergensis]